MGEGRGGKGGRVGGGGGGFDFNRLTSSFYHKVYVWPIHKEMICFFFAGLHN